MSVNELQPTPPATAVPALKAKNPRLSKAMKGNTNALRTPEGRASALWKRRLLRPDDRWVGRVMGDHRAALLGDRPDATAAELATIDLCALARGCTVLLMAAAAERPGDSRATWPR